MRKAKKTLLILVIGATASSCSTIKMVHVPLDPTPICVFEKFTEKEKDSMTEQVGKKIDRNQQTCLIDRERLYRVIKAHNEAHDA